MDHLPVGIVDDVVPNDVQSPAAVTQSNGIHRNLIAIVGPLDGQGLRRLAVVDVAGRHTKFRAGDGGEECPLFQLFQP